MNVQAASSSPEGLYLLSRTGKPQPSVDQKILSNEFPFGVRALFNTFNACFMAGTSKEFNETALSSEITSEVKFGMDFAVVPFPILNFLGLLKEWENAVGRDGEIQANGGLMASLERDCLELDAQLASWPENDPGRLDRQKEIDGKRAVCLQLTARNNALRALAPPTEGRAATVGSGVTPVIVAVNNGVTAVLKRNANAAIDITKAADATAGHELSDVATSTVTGLAIGLVNSACHLIRAFPEVHRAMAQLDGLKAAEHRLAQAVEVSLQSSGSSEVLDNVVASMVPLIGNTRSQARIIAVDAFFRTVQGASGLALKSAGIAAAVLGPSAPFAAGVAIAGLAMGAGWLTWQAARLWRAQTLKVAAAKIENQLKNDVAIAKKSLATNAEHPHISATMAPWLKLIEGCRAEAPQGPLTSFLRDAGISESVIGACLSKEKAALDLVVPLFSAFKESLLTATPEVTRERIDALKKCKDPRDVLNGFILEVENPDCPVNPQRNKTLKPVGLTNQGNTLTLEEVQRHLSEFKSGRPVDLKSNEGYAAQLLTQYFVDAKDKPGDARKLEKTLLTRVKLFIDLSQNSDERAIACLRGRYPGIWGGSKFGHQVVRETAEAYLRSKYDGPGFEEKLGVLACLAKKKALVRSSGPFEWGKTWKVWQPTEAATEMAKWLANSQHVPSAELVRQVFQKHHGVPESEHDGAVSFLTKHVVGQDWTGYELGAALNALKKGDVKSLFDSRALGEEKNTVAVEHALRLQRGLAPSATDLLDPIQALKSLHAEHPRVAQAVLDALMGKRFDVPVLSDDVAGQVRAIRDAYGDHFLEGETKGSAVFFIPRKPGPEDSKVLEKLVEVARKDARSYENWPSALISSSTLPLLEAVNKKANPSIIRRFFGKLLSFIPLISRLPFAKNFLKRLETESNAVKALADQLQRNLDSARKSVPASFSPLWTPEYYVGTKEEVEHAVRAQRLSAIFPAEVYDKDDKTKCQDIDDTLDMLYAWSRKTPGGRKLLRVIAQGGSIQSKVAMHWLFDRQSMLSGVQQTEIRRIAESMPQMARSSKPFLKRLTERHSVWRTQLKDGIARYTMAEFDAAMKPKSASSHVPQEDMNQQVKTMRLVASTGSLATTNFSGSEEPDMHDRSDLLVPLSVSLLPLKERKLKMPQVDKTVPVDEDLLQVPVPLALE